MFQELLGPKHTGKVSQLLKKVRLVVRYLEFDY